MADPVFDITIATSSADSRVLVNGDDITSCLRGVRIEQRAGEMPSVHLELIGAKAAVRVSAAIGMDKIGMEVPAADVTPLGAESEVKAVLP